MKIEKEDRSNKYNPVHKKMHELWRSMMSRCYSNKSGSYRNYGAVGVTVCEKWKKYDGFLDDVDKIDGFDIEKILRGDLQLDKDIKQEKIPSNKKIYSLSTCTFATRSDNSANRHNNKKFVAMNMFTGEVILTQNRELLCREKDLDTSSVWRILQSNLQDIDNIKEKMYHGWAFQYLETFDIEKIPKQKLYILESPDKEIIMTQNVSKFKRDMNIETISNSKNFNGKWRQLGSETIKYKYATTIGRQLIDYGIISETE